MNDRLEYVVREDRYNLAWVVEAADADGRVQVTRFTGPDCEKRAYEYAAWKTNAEYQRIRPTPTEILGLTDRLQAYDEAHGVGRGQR